MNKVQVIGHFNKLPVLNEKLEDLGDVNVVRDTGGVSKELD